MVPMLLKNARLGIKYPASSMMGGRRNCKRQNNNCCAIGLSDITTMVKQNCRRLPKMLKPATEIPVE